MSLNVIASDKIKSYLDQINKETNRLHKIATEARKNGFDPEDRVDIMLADSIPQKVEGLISSIAPQIVNSGVSNRIYELEKRFGTGDWRVGLEIAKEVAQEKFCKFDSKEEAIGVGIRTGLAYTTQGVVSAPLEGLAEIKLRKRQDGREYLAIYYAGPIRGAGGTHQALSVIIGDYVRLSFGIADYDPTEDEIKRYCTEVIDYYDRVERKQYRPTPEETTLLIKNIGVEINGDPTAQIDVSNYKNLPRIETNRIRGGLCLVLLDGIPLKAAKIWKQLQKWQGDFGLDWSFLEKFLKLKEKIRSHSSTDDKKEYKKDTRRVKPNYYYISEIVAGRPVFGYPLEKGGFRLRYGRSRLTGDGSWAVSPMTMYVLKDYVATGTQFRVERPGKSTALTVCDYIDGPIVKLKDESVIRVETEDQVKKIKNKIKEILFIGDILISHGDFAEQGSTLVPAGYCEEWWVLELKAAEKSIQHNLPNELLREIKSNPIKTRISAENALKISQVLNIPLHPYYTFHWNDINKEEYIQLFEWFNKKEFYLDSKVKKTLEIIGCPHSIQDNKIVFEQKFLRILNYFLSKKGHGKTALECINSVSNIKLRDKSGTFIGARMGRPEKAKIRELKGAPQVLFPVGKEGGRMRSVIEASGKETITAQFPIFECQTCNKRTIYKICEICNSKAEQWRICPVCRKKTKKQKCHKETIGYETQKIKINEYLKRAKDRLKVDQLPTLIKGVRGTSNKDHYVEYLGKGILRSKYNLRINKDGTVRYDMTELGITHFRLSEIGLSVEKAKELGYIEDKEGNKLVNENQVVEILPQDVILPACPDSDDRGADEILVNVAKFVDDELRLIYGMNSFYNITSKDDLIGHLVIGLAPHISAGIIGRIIGFSKTQGCFAHPYWHDAQRRDLDGEETSVMLLMDAFLNFSRQYLPDRRGSRSMDAPLVLSAVLNPMEIDDEVYDVDTVDHYPLEFYRATLQFKKPWDIKIEQIKDRIGKPEQYEGMKYTHEVTDMNMGVKNSAYKSIPTMLEKLKGQMDLAKELRAVHFTEVARLVIEGHFIRDIKGNLRKFTTQKFRCTNCNEKYRRPPLSGNCKCGRGNIIFTIHEGTIKKYLEPSIILANYEGVDEYISQSMMIVKRRIDSIFGEEKTKQVGLGSFMNGK